MFTRSIKSGQLLVAIAAAVATPNSIFIGRAALSALSLLGDELSARHPTLNKLAREIDRDFNRALASPAYDKPADARQLLPQMLEVSAARMEFAHHGLDAGRILDDLIDRLDAPDYRPEHIRAFRRLLAPILASVCDDPRLKEALDPALTRIQMQRQQEQSTQIEAILDRLGGIEQALEAPQTLTRSELGALAARFGGDGTAEPAALIEFLTDKAEDYRAYRDQIDSLDDRVTAVAGLKAKALAAAESLDFDAVEDILSQVSEAEARIFAETSVARARNALMRGRAEQAHRLLSAAADSFAALSPAHPVQQRNEYAAILLAHGQRHGGAALPLAAAMLETAISQAGSAGRDDLASTCRQNLAIALHNHARQTAGAQSTAMLERAIALLQDALAGFSRTASPADWGTAQLNLGAVLNTLAARTAGERGIALMMRTIEAFEAALSVSDRARDPRDWSRLQQNLGVALKTLGERQTGPESAAALRRSAAAFKAALAAISRERDADDWATIQLNLANTLTAQAEIAEGPARAGLIDDAVAVLEDALTVYTRRDTPLDFAMVQINLGNALAFQGSIAPGPEGAAALARAEAAYESALTCHDEHDTPMHWAMIQENLAHLHFDWARHDSANTDPAGHYEAALDHIDNALRVYDPEHASHDFETATALRDEILAGLA